MSYRKIEVNGKSYEYVIGKMNTKIKNIGVFLNDRIAKEIWWTGECDCSMRKFCDEAPVYSGFSVTPSVIRRLIMNNEKTW